MSTITLAKMREIQEFIPYDKWPNHLHTNCIAYALGLPIDDPYMEIFNYMLIDKPVDKLTKILEGLDLDYRIISNPSELRNDELCIVLYHYYYEKLRSLFGCSWTEHLEETHLARIELDGTWTHKFGWDYDPSITSPEEIHDIILQDDHVDVQPTAYFAIRKPR